MNQIKLEKNKSYDLTEVVELVQNTLDSVKENSEYCPLKFSRTDVYWLLHDMLSYVNRNVPGEFALKVLSKGTYRVQYRNEKVRKLRSSRQLKKNVEKTADYLEKLTGRRPTWGKK